MRKGFNEIVRDLQNITLQVEKSSFDAFDARLPEQRQKCFDDLQNIKNQIVSLSENI